MRGDSAKPKRRGIDTAILVVVAACLVIEVVRVVLVAVTVPYALYVDRHLTAEAKAAGRAAPDTSLAERVAGSWTFRSWWSDRRVPYREGGDYLGVLSHHSAGRTLGAAIGVLVEQLRDEGVPVDQVIVAENREALYGEEAGTPMVRADGTAFRSYWAPPSTDAARFTDLPVVERDYDPELTAGQAAALAARTELQERANAVYVGSPNASGSGTWIVYVRDGKSDRREFLLVPVEVAPAGGDR